MKLCTANMAVEKILAVKIQCDYAVHSVEIDQITAVLRESIENNSIDLFWGVRYEGKQLQIE